MRRIVAGVVVLLLAWPVLADDEKPKDKSKDSDQQTPAEQYQALVKEFNDARQAFTKEWQEAKTQADKQKVIKEKQPQPDKYAAKFIELAEKNPKDPVAVDALSWVLSNTFGFGPAIKDTPRAKAVALLTHDHIESAKLGTVCQMLAGRGNDKEAETLLRTILDKNPHKEVQSEACLALAQMIGQKVNFARQINNPEKLDLAKLEGDSAKLYKQFAEKYLPDLPQVRIDALLMRLGYNPDKGSEVLARTLADESAMGVKREIRGKACLALAQMLKRRAEGMPDTDPKAIEKVQKESEEFYNRVVEKYADVKSFRGTIGDQAENERFEMLHLSKGKPAPDIEAEDLDGKEFKLSDYKGKVVLIDFWGNW
jgi:hypothetical protein